MSEHNHMDVEKRHQSFFTPRGGIVLGGFLLIAGYFLVTEHSAHLALAIPYLPFLLLAACPLLHVFMHRGHGNHQDRANSNGDRKPTGGTAP